MTNHFSLLTFTVFRGCSMKAFSDAIYNDEFIQELLDSGKAKCYKEELSCDFYADPAIGFCLCRFSWWESSLYPDTVFFMSNYSDGFMTLCYQLWDVLRCECIKCRICRNEYPYPLNDFHYRDSNGNERYVRSMKEDRWSFIEMGEPLPFEDLSLYKNKYIKDRMNMGIIIQYLNNMGISFETMDKEVKECMTFERTAR